MPWSTKALLIVLLGSVPWAALADENWPAAAKAPDEVDNSRSSKPSMEQALFTALNALRRDPKSFLPDLETMRAHFKGRRMSLPGEITLVTQEGPAALDEAMEFVKKAPVRAPFKASCGMSRAAEDQARDMRQSGILGHSGSDGSTPSVRLRRYGTWRSKVGENIALGSASGRRMVLQLLIDDGVPSRGHRKNMFREDFRVVGIGCETHPKWRTVCVIDFAGAFEESSPPSKCDPAHPQNPAPSRKVPSEN